MHKRRPGLRFGQKLNSGAPRALDPRRLVGTIEDFVRLDEITSSNHAPSPLFILVVLLTAVSDAPRIRYTGPY